MAIFNSYVKLPEGTPHNYVRFSYWRIVVGIGEQFRNNS